MKIPDWLTIIQQPKQSLWVWTQRDECVASSVNTILDQSTQIEPLKPIQYLLENLWYKCDEKWGYSVFEWKKVLDIWGGFSWIVPHLVHSAEMITVVDPIFAWNIPVILEANIVAQQNVLESISYQRESGNIDIESIDFSKRQKCAATLVLDDCIWWRDEYSPEKYPNIVRNPSYWERIDWVEEESQDFIFLNYVLSQKNLNPLFILKEANRLLKQWWTLIITDNSMKELLVRFLGKNFILEDKSQNEEVFLVCIKK